MPPILHGELSNNSNNCQNTNNCINENVNDYLYYQIFVKNKKNKKIDMKKHIEFLSKHNTLITKK
jgi:hypothetical protein